MRQIDLSVAPKGLPWCKSSSTIHGRGVTCGSGGMKFSGRRVSYHYNMYTKVQQRLIPKQKKKLSSKWINKTQNRNARRGPLTPSKDSTTAVGTVPTRALSISASCISFLLCRLLSAASECLYHTVPFIRVFLLWQEWQCSSRTTRVLCLPFVTRRAVLLWVRVWVCAIPNTVWTVSTNTSSEFD